MKWRTLLACAVLCGVTLFLIDRRLAQMASSFERVSSRIEQLAEAIQPMSMTWQSGGQPHTYGPIHSKPGETPAEYAGRFQKGLAQEMAAFPPDVPQ